MRKFYPIATLDPNSSAAVNGVTPARALGFYFVDLVLVGHEFTSSFEKDHTNFDETKTTQIKKGETTQSQVIALMGQPTGNYIFPLVQRNDEKGLVYFYMQTRVEQAPFVPTKIKTYRKVLVVSVGEDGVVIDLNEEARARMNCEVKLEIIPGATHLFEEPGALEQVAQLTADWFVHRTLEKRRFDAPA